jgi:hypothetical protein
MKRIAYAVVLWVGVLGAQRGTNAVRQNDIDRLIAALYRQPWQGAVNLTTPICWEFNFTQPMKRLLKIGPKAQDPLLAKLFDPAISDQVIILLGGVGDERSVGPIIRAMKLALQDPMPTRRERTLSAGDLALTNITVSEVVWHHGGGITVDQCPGDHVTCWSAWWQRNEATFRVRAITQSRRYTNYPNYGIYQGRP